MSQLVVENASKKRKHIIADVEQDTEPSVKRAKKDKLKKDKSVRKEKGKARARDDETEFRVVQTSMVVSIPPVFASNLRAGVEEMLDSLLMRYIPALQGVVLSHGSLRFLDTIATIKADCPFTNCRIAFDATVWSPQVGMKLVGKVNLCSPDHIALLVHRTFNVSIPRHHIPTHDWEFEYGPAENDPEFGTDIMDENVLETGENTPVVEGGGRWVHKLTGAKMGGDDGRLEFTVVGLTIANQMLSLVGSVQFDPFSPEHALPAPTKTSANIEVSRTRAAEHEALVLDNDFLEQEAGNEDDDRSPFAELGRLADEAAADLRARQDKTMGPSKKRKRKDAVVRSAQ
ncbi:uncharacterized protein FIBRA_01093 [Fibroporia radiculosa]|uniref:RPA43 OB domain-containing protein n=1 Tax=Fibroporia radiculosa TaxID=599839 RepID=J4GJA6_9APHY|nr:uncharacterized protein FIBRA_01093 [Fibroporia radiculosa]CCL99080.1 predicted protein [Fibroporia radiculosa]